MNNFLNKMILKQFQIQRKIAKTAQSFYIPHIQFLLLTSYINIDGTFVIVFWLLFNCSSFGYQECFQFGSCVPLTHLHHCGFFGSTFLALGPLQVVAGSSCTFSTLVLESVVSPGSLWGLFLKNAIRNQNRGVRHAHCC